MTFLDSGGEIYTVFDEESESAVRIDEFLHPEEKIRVKIFEKKIRKKILINPYKPY